jgi:nucleotide-binding universal stress UspA family protein
MTERGGDIVVGFDGRAEALDALALGQRLAGLDDASLVVVAAYPYAPLSSRILDEPTDASTAWRALDEARRALGARDAELLTVPGSTPGRTLHEIAERRDAACIVVGSSHRGPPGRLVLGGVTAETLRQAPCAVAVAPRGWAAGPGALARIGVAVDGSERDVAAVGAAAAMAERAGPQAAVETIHVEPTFRRGGAAPRVEAQLQLGGEAADALAAHSTALDLLVLGSRECGRLGAVILGSVAARLVGMARCPVLVLPGQGGTGPVVTAGSGPQAVASDG